MAASTAHEFYSISDADAQRAYVGMRRAAEWVGFFLPYLQPGFSLLDCGCGVGSITLDLAAIVAPGRVIGIDRDESQLAIARANAAQRGLTNVSFEPGNVYALRFKAESFDAVLAHTLLYHLGDPLRALREMRRVLKPSGVAAVSDDDWATIVSSPADSPVQQATALMTKVVEFNGGSPFYSRHLRGLMLQAGFVKTEGYAVAAEHYGTLDETRRIAAIVRGVFTSPDFVALVTGQGWATKPEIENIVASIQAWGDRPDAFYAVMYCAAVGRNRGQ